METTGDVVPRPFLIYDAGVAEERRFLIFAADECSRVLSMAYIWFMDGNFSMAPRIFKQIYIIMILLSLVFMLSWHTKNQETHREMLKAVVHKFEELGFNVTPQQIVTDFEQPLFRAHE